MTATDLVTVAGVDVLLVQVNGPITGSRPPPPTPAACWAPSHGLPQRHPSATHATRLTTFSKYCRVYTKAVDAKKAERAMHSLPFIGEHKRHPYGGLITLCVYPSRTRIYEPPRRVYCALGSDWIGTAPGGHPPRASRYRLPHRVCKA